MTTPNNVPNPQAGPSTARDTNYFVEDTASPIPEELITLVSGHCNLWRTVIMLIFCIIMIIHGLNVFSCELLVPHHLKVTCSDEIFSENYCFTSNGSACPAFHFSRAYGYTITEKWGLICGEARLIDSCDIAFKIGLAIGFITLGYTADRAGRKKVLFFSLLLQPLSALLSVISENVAIFTVIRFFHGFALSGTALIVLVLTCEISSNKWRTIAIGLVLTASALGNALLPFVWMIFADSMKNILLISLPQFLFIVFIGIIRESPNWLLCNNKTNRAEEILIQIAHFNGYKIPSAFRIRPVQITAKDYNLNIFTLLCKPPSACITIALLVTCFIGAFLCSLIFAHLLTKYDDVLKVLKYAGLCNVCGAILSLVLCSVMQHKIVIALCTFLGCTIETCIYLLIKEDEFDFSDYNDSEFSLQLVVYTVLCTAVYTTWNLAPRIIPTVLRGFYVGLATAIIQLSFMITRLIFNYVYNKVEIFLIILGSGLLLICFCCKLLYSVHKRELPDLIEDSINFRHTHKPTRWTTIRATSPTLDETEVKMIDFERDSSLTVEHLNAAFYFLSFRKKSIPEENDK